MESFFREAFSDKNIIFSIFLIIGTVELLVVYFMYQYRQRMIEGGLEATGKVIDILSNPSPKGTAFYLVFHFRTYMNEEITIQSKITSSPSPSKPSDK